MTGKEFKKLVAEIPDKAVVEIAVDYVFDGEENETWYEIKGIEQGNSLDFDEDSKHDHRLLCVGRITRTFA